MIPGDEPARSVAMTGDEIQSVQHWRKVFALAAAPVLLIWTSLVSAVPTWEHPVEHLGLIAIMLCVIGRAWCSLYIGGRKKVEIVTEGPYSVCRNPLYVFSFVGAFGVGAQTGSLAIGLAFAVAAWALFRVVVAQEETFLNGAFDQVYAAYRARTPRFLPNPKLWRDGVERIVRPVYFLRTVRDGLFFLIAIPVFEGLERLQQLGWLDPRLQLP